MYSYLVFLLIISLSLMNNCDALVGRKIMQKEYFTFDPKSFFSPSCKPSVAVAVRSRPESLKVKHRYGYCSKSSLNDGHIEPSLAEILERDQIRVESIQNSHGAFKTQSSNIDDLGDSKASNIPAESGSTLGNGNYVVSVGLGTPAKYVTLAFDTGSSLTWTQCQPCAGQCYPQKDSIFDPSSSTSYSNASCSSAQCSQLSNLGYLQNCTVDSTCIYGEGYGDNSTTFGYLGSEKLTLTPNDVFGNFTFGCGEANKGLFGATAGFFGLGPDSFSVVSQTAGKYGKYFSYCLPTRSGSNGHLTLGNDDGATGNLVFTPLGIDAQGAHYSVNIVAISVGGTQLAISPSVFQSGGAIIDSGTVITRLPPTAYAALRDAFKQQMSQYPLAPPVSLFDTCYNFSNSNFQGIPNISFIFQGNVKVDLGLQGVLYPLRQPIACLAFAANNVDTDGATFGNVQQQTFEVAYDVAGGRLGFSPGGCS